MSQTYYPQYPYNLNQEQSNKHYVQELFAQNKLAEHKRQLKTALHNPKDDYVYLEDPSAVNQSTEYTPENKIPWKSYPKVINTKRYNELIERSAAGKAHANDDQVEYGFYTEEFQNEALLAHSAGILTSTEFPSITVTTVQTELLRNELLVAQKYNLLQITETKNTDQLYLVYPEYDDTTKAVRVGYKENDPIETVGWGAFTESRIGLEKSGAGIGFTEEFYMRQFTYPIQNFILEHIAQDFARVKHERLVALLPSFADVAGADWGAYSAANIMSTNRPSTNLTTVKTAINADKRASANTVVSREDVLQDYLTNTWVKGPLQAISVPATSQNDTITNIPGAPFIDRWIINEDVVANVAFVFDNRAFLMIQGPRKTTQFENNNPQQTIFLQKDWFKQHLRKSTWGRELTGISV